MTKFLRALAEEVETSLRDESSGEFRLITRAEMLALVLWKKALGWIEPNKIKDGPEIVHKPESWAIQLIYERLEGRAPQAVPDAKGHLTAADKIDELAKSKLNRTAEAVAAIPCTDSSVDRPDNGSEGPEGPETEPGMAGTTPEAS